VREYETAMQEHTSEEVAVQISDIFGSESGPAAAKLKELIGGRSS